MWCGTQCSRVGRPYDNNGDSLIYFVWDSKIWLSDGWPKTFSNRFSRSWRIDQSPYPDLFRPYHPIPLLHSPSILCSSFPPLGWEPHRGLLRWRKTASLRPFSSHTVLLWPFAWYEASGSCPVLSGGGWFSGWFEWLLLRRPMINALVMFFFGLGRS